MDNKDRDQFYMEIIEKEPCNILLIEEPKKEWIDYAISLNLDLINHFMTDERYDQYEYESDMFNNLDGLSFMKTKDIILQDPRSILKLSDPPEPLKIIAVSKMPELILELTEVTTDIWKVAIQKKPEYIKFLEDPTEELQLESVMVDAVCIKYIRQPTIEVQRYIVKRFPEYIPLIQNVSDTIVIEVVKTYGIRYLGRFSRLTDTVKQMLKDLQ